tara:strand:+ start:339 stop:515 length:177 start_codon:yes stop_codon:yes gene_type:complete
LFRDAFMLEMNKKNVKKIVKEKITDRYLRLTTSGSLNIAGQQQKVFEQSLQNLYDAGT